MRKIFTALLFILILLPSFSDDKNFIDQVDGQIAFYNSLIEGEFPGESFREEGYTVQELIDAALSTNPSILNAVTAMKKSISDTKGVRAKAFPQVDFQTAFTFIGNPMDPVSVTAGQFGTVNFAGEEILLPNEDILLYSGMESWNYDFKLILDQPLFTWGKITTGIEMSRTAETVAALQVQKIEKETRTNIKVLCQSLYYLQILQDILELQREVGDRLLEISERSYESGFLIYSEVLDARVQAIEIDSVMVDLDGQIQNIISQLSYLTGYSNLTVNDIKLSKEDLISPQAQLPSSEGTKENTLKNSSDLAMLRELMVIKELQNKIDQRSDFLHPDLGLHVELGYSGSRFPFIEKDWYGQDDYQLTISLALQDNLFDGGATASAITSSQLDREAIGYQYEEAISQIGRTIDNSWIKLNINRQRLAYYATKMESKRAQIDSTRKKWESGVGSETDYLIEIIELLTEEISGIQELLQYNQNAAVLLSLGEKS